MRNVILQEFVTVDGFAADANGSVDFIPATMGGDQGFGQRQVDFMSTIDAILLGRVTYEMFAGYWPNATTGEDAEFAARINAIPKVVFSRTLEHAPWGSFEPARIVRTDASEEVAKLKQASGKDMVVWGSISLAQSLLDDGLADAVQLIVCPLAFGKGRSMFARPLDMTLESTRSFDSGAVLLEYAPEPRAR